MAEPEDSAVDPATEPAEGQGRTDPVANPDDTVAGETAELPHDHDAPTERRPPVAAEPVRDDAEPPHLRDVTSALGDYLRSRAARLAELVGSHRLVAALAAFAIVAVAVLAALVATSTPNLPSAELVADDASAALATPAYSSGSFGRDDILVPREVDVRSIVLDDRTGDALAEVMVTYSGSHGIGAEKAATLRYARSNGGWALAGEPEGARVSWSTTEGVDEGRVIGNADAILERADRSLEQGGSAEEPTLAQLYADAEVSVEASSFDLESQTESMELVFSRDGAFERYECRINVSFAFRSASGQWEVESVSVADGARRRSLDPLVGTWTGSFQSQETQGEKCLASRDAGLVVTISSVRNDAGLEQVAGTVSGMAHYHAGPSSDTAASDGDTSLDGVPFTANLTEDSDGSLVFEGTLPEDVGGTVSLELVFGSADDPSRAVARVTTTYVHEGSFLFLPYDETFTYVDLFTLARAADAGQER